MFKKKKQVIIDKAPEIKAPTSVSIMLPDAKLSYGNGQHQGKRSYQEDSFGISDTRETAAAQNGVLAVLADGMGGLKNGSAVSEALVMNLIRAFESSTSVINGESLKSVVASLNQGICERFCSSGKTEAGSTLVAALIKNGYLHWVCVGDSRLYIKRGCRLYKMNEDHDLLNELLDSVLDGTLDINTAFGDKQKDCLAECIGKASLNSFDYSKNGYKLHHGDIIMLCSDGVYNAVNENELSNYVTVDAMDSCARIIQRIQEKNFANQDNNTVMILLYENK